MAFIDYDRGIIIDSGWKYTLLEFSWKKTLNIDPKIFRKLSSDQALEQLHSSSKGLSNREARKRQLEQGLNKLPEAHKRALALESLIRAVNPLSGILLVASIISAYTGEVLNAMVIVGIVLIGILLDYFQSHRALTALKRLRAKFAIKATVLRDGEWSEVLSEKVVPGDILQLMAGDLVVADSLLLSSKDLHVQQASLTGESLPVEKEATFQKTADTPLLEAKNMVFSGSSVVSGNAIVLVYATGVKTVLGNIAKTLNATPPRTEFENSINRFGSFIFKTVISLVLFIFLMSIYFKRDLLDSFLFSIALAVGLTPEFLPMITMVTLAAGAVKMSRKKVIIKNLASIQNLGSIDVLCSDKTGTLTSGEMSLERYLNILGGSSQKIFSFAYINSVHQSGIKNPIDEAILKKSNINPLDIAILKHHHPEIPIGVKLDEIPFDFERRRSTVVLDNNDECLLIVKGAPEQIFELCNTYEVNEAVRPIDADIKTKFSELFQSMGQQGYRLLAVAYRKMDPKPSYHSEDEAALTFLGFLIFTDPPLPEVAKVIRSLARIGVQVKILTGDNALVAQTVCKNVGIPSEKILSGKEIENLSDSLLEKKIEEVMVFARVSPNQKQRIITALRRRGHIVGFIGDGINDAASMRFADVGIAVSNAVDIAKETASVILLKHDLKVLLSGILEGRKAFGNVMKYLMMGTSSNFGNMFSMSIAILFLPFLPMLPSQILLNNFLYDISQLSIPTDKVDPQFMRKPRHWDIDIIRRFMIYIGPISSLFDLFTFYVLLKIFLASEALFQTGWFVESLATQTLVIFVIRTVRNPFKNRPSFPLVFSICVIVILSVLLPYSFVARYFSFAPLPLSYLLFIAVMTVVYLIIVQVVKQRLMWHWVVTTNFDHGRH